MRVDGVPTPNGRMESRALMTFALANGTIEARVHIVQTFGADGAHARHTATGSVTAASGAFADYGGTISGSGTLVDTRAGVRNVRLHYVLALKRS